MATNLRPRFLALLTRPPGTAAARGWITTGRQKSLSATPKMRERHRARQCLPDPVEPGHVARRVVFPGPDDAAISTANNNMVEAGSI